MRVGIRWPVRLNIRYQVSKLTHQTTYVRCALLYDNRRDEVAQGSEDVDENERVSRNARFGVPASTEYALDDVDIDLSFLHAEIKIAFTLWLDP